MAAFAGTAFSTSAFSVNAFDFGSTPPAPTPPAEEQASNWQANYWVHKRRTKADEDEERRRLGILPPEQQEQAEQAVREAVDASIAAQKDEDKGRAILALMEARQAFEDAYRQAFKEAYIEEMMLAEWESQITRERRRRAIALLLLH